MDKEAYVCDPKINTECKKTGCYINGGMCEYTTDKRFAVKDDTGAAIKEKPWTREPTGLDYARMKQFQFEIDDTTEQAWRAGYLQGLTSANQKRFYSASTAKKIKIVGKLPSLNEYIEACRRNPHCGAKMKASTEAAIMPQLASLPKIEKPVHITFIWQEANKRRDKDNVAAGKKFILDALQKAGKLINDNNDYIAGFTDRFEYGGKEYGCTLIIEGANNE